MVAMLYNVKPERRGLGVGGGGGKSLSHDSEHGCHGFNSLSGASFFVVSLVKNIRLYLPGDEQSLLSFKLDILRHFQ